MLFYILIFVVSVLVILNKLFSGESYWKKRNIKEVCGTLSRFVLGNRSLSEGYKEIYDKNDGVVGVFFGAQPFLILKDLEDINTVLAGDFQSFYKRGILMNENDTLANNTLLLNDFKKWKCIRQKLTPLFTSAKLKNVFPIINSCARDFINIIEEKEEMRSMSFDGLCAYTVSTIGAAVFGINTISKDSLNSPFIEMTQKSINPKFNFRFILATLYPSLLKWLNIKLFEEHETFFMGFMRKALKERREDGQKRHDFIDLCIELQNQGLMKDLTTDYAIEPTEDLLAAQAFSFFLAGVDTTATALHFILLELSKQQEILNKLHKEIDNVFEGVNDELTYDDVEKLQYLDMVISEVMRKYPSVGFLQRICTKKTVLPASNVTVEKDCGVIIPVYPIHRDERYFPNPEKLIPERFAPDNISNVQKGSYLPFGDGNRMCIGYRFARLQMRTVLAWMLRRFTLQERDYKPKHFDKTPFSIRDTKAKFQLIPRKLN